MASAMEQSSSINNIYPFKDVKSSIDPILNYDKGKSGNVLIIDNGKYILRFKTKGQLISKANFEVFI